MSGAAHSFVEESVWDRRDQRRANPREVIFRITSIGKIQGRRIDEIFVSDFGLFYDPEDVDLILALSENFPDVDWERLVYWKRQDQATIDLIDPMTDEIVGSITVRRRVGGDPSGETDWTNVVRLIPAREEE